MNFIYSFMVIFVVFGRCLSQKRAQEKCAQFVFRNRIKNIIGGIRTKDNEFPHMAALGFGSRRNIEWLCGGTLISDQFVLTAAHCTSLKSRGQVKLVRLGTRTLTPKRGSSYKDVRVSQITRHPKYKSPSSYNDIALLKLENPVEFSRSILPACLNAAFNANLATNTLTALGWGNTEFLGSPSDDLLEVGLRISSKIQCNRSYKDASKEKLPNGIKDSLQICAGDQVNKDTCQGDSGGPLEYTNGRFHYIVGITSFGKACGIAGAPGVYTRVSAFVPWIESIVWP